MICDVLIEQDIFSGVRNIIKNEIPYRVRMQPESALVKIPAVKINELINESRNYRFQFLEWKRIFEVKKHWLAQGINLCLRCNFPIVRKQTGYQKRRSFICTNCQTLCTQMKSTLTLP